MRPFLIPFLLFFLPCSLLQAQGFRQESSVLPKTGTQIKVESAFSALGSWGYYPVTVTLRNESSNDSTFSLKTNSDSSAPTYGMGEARSIETKANFNLSCPAGSEKSFDLLLPISMASFGYNGRYFGSGNDDETENSLHLEFKSGNEKWSTSVSGEHDLSKYSKVYSIATAPKVTTTSARLINTLNPKLLPVSLQAMSGYDDLLLSEADWNSLKEEAKSSLITWVEQGGQLAVIGEKGTSRTLATLLEKELKLSPFNKKGGLFLHTLNNGSIWTGSLENLKTIENRLNATERTKVQLNDLKNGYDDKSGSKLKWPIHQKLGVKKFDTIIIALLLVVFTIIVGPINFFVFAKQGKRHRLFFTTPLISLGMSALLIGYIVVKDGFGGKGHRILLKDINQEANSSFVIQEQISRTGMLFSSTFEMDNDLTIVQVPIKSSRWARVTNTKSTSKEMYTINRGDSTSTHNGNYFSSRSMFQAIAARQK